MSHTVQAVDLFCGAGGTSTGLALACKELGRKVNLTAINHWPEAVETHTANHPWANHICQDVRTVNPEEVIPGGRCHILVASPECIYYSRAAGGRPKLDQYRATAWDILPWLERVRVSNLLIENVPEFCFVAGTMVWTENGAVPIEEIQIGTSVLTHKGRWRKVIDTSSRKAETTVKVSGVSNMSIECTPNHLFWARERGALITKSGKYGRHVLQLMEPTWIQAVNLQPLNTTTYSEKYTGYAWATPHKTDDLPIAEAPEGLDASVPAFWRIVGRWLGDGWIKRRKDRKHYKVRICEDTTKAPVLFTELKLVRGIHWNVSESRASVVIFEATHHPLAKWLIKHFGEHADKKTVPAWITSLSKENRQAFLAGYVSADGNARSTERVLAVTSSKRLAIGVKMLVQSLGIPAGMGHVSPGEPHLLNCKLVRGKGGYWVSWKEDARFYESVKDETHFWSKVQTSEPLGHDVHVYDLTVEEDSSFVADGVVVHNCNWGPVNGDGHPIKRLKGTIYQAWLRAIRAHGYNIDTRILNAADYGAATSRARFFLIAKKGNAPIVWPTSTKSKKGLGKKKWRGAKEIIDWSLKGESIFTRKRPLSDTTMRRIIAGLKRFGGHELQPFLVLMEHGGGIRSVDEPLPTITTAKGGSMAIADPAFILSQASGGAPRSVDDPMPTITGGGGDAIVQPFILPVRGFFGQNTPKSINDPLGTITQRGGGDLIQPFIIPYFGERDGQKPRTHAVEEPLPAVTSHGAGALIDACLVKYYGNGGPQSVDDPLGTLTTKDRYGLAEPYLVRFNGTENAASEDSRRAWKNSAKSTAEPLPTVTGGQRFGLAEPYLVRFNGTDQAHITDSSRSIDDPLPTVVGSNSHFALIQPEASGCYLDIRFRMLQPHELSAAMGFPAGYAFVGNKTEVIKQIGNAVVVQVAQALVMSLLTTTSKKGRLV